MGILRADRITGLGGANAIKGSVFFPHDGTATTTSGVLQVQNENDALTFGTGDFTIEFWFYTNRIGVTQHLYDGRGTGAGSNAAVLIQISDSNNIRFFTTSNYRITGSSTLKANTWYHIALTRTGSTHTLYVNGASDGTYSASNTYTGPTNGFSAIGSDDNGAGAYGLNGYISNLRVSKELVYSAAFTVPTTELAPTPNTTLLCCQSPGNAQASFGGLTLTSFAASTNSRGPEASRFTPNSPVGFSTTTDVGGQYGSTFDGFGSFATSTYMVPPGGNTRERGRGRALIMGGAVSPGATNTTQIKYFDIASQGITEDFGQTTVARRAQGALSSSTRGCVGGGFVAPTSPAHTVSDVIDFVTIANTANAIDFGNMQSTGYHYGTASNQTRGLFAGGYRPNNSAVVDTIDLITIATTGNASDFGNLVVARRSFGGLASPTRGIFMGGAPSTKDEIDYVTIATTGNATDFGNLTDGRDFIHGSSSSTRGVMGGGRDPNTTNIIDYITIASTGNATDFGDLTQTSYYFNAATSNSSRAVWVAASTIVNSMEYVTIATTGNSIDWGDQGGTTQHSSGACSDSHGGLS